MEENNDNTIFGIEKGDILKYALYAEAGLIAYGGVIAMGLEAPKYAHATTHAATTVQADALLPDGSYSVLNADAAKVRTKTNYEAKLAENQLTNMLIKPQAALVEPIVGLLFPMPDITVTKYTPAG